MAFSNFLGMHQLDSSFVCLNGAGKMRGAHAPDLLHGRSERGMPLSSDALHLCRLLARTVDVLAAGLEPICRRAFADFAFKRRDLAVAEARLNGLLRRFVFGFVFVAMSPAQLIRNNAS